MDRAICTLILASLSTLSLQGCDRGGSEATSTQSTPATNQARPAKSDLEPLPQAQEPVKPIPAKTEIVFSTSQGERRVQVEVVSSPAKIPRGLMYRKHLPPDHGMLFVFSTDKVRSFWMKNTLIPLDMLFVRKDGSIAGIERDTTPQSLESRSVGLPTRYVLELNGGWTAKYGVETGATLRIENLPEISGAPF